MIFKTLRRFVRYYVRAYWCLALVDQKAAPRVTSWSTSCSSRQVGIAMLNEATARSFSLRVHERQAGAYIHVDDAVFISSTGDGPVHCDKLLDRAVGGLEEVGFQVSQQSRAGSLDKVVGYEIVQKPAEFRLPKKKMTLLRSALLFVVNQKMVNVKTLHTLVGMWIFVALLRRDLLSVPHAVFRFIEAHEDQTVNWWPVARDEVTAMAHVIPLMVCHVGSPILDWLFSTDAMGANEVDYGGYGIAVTRAGQLLGWMAFMAQSSQRKRWCRQSPSPYYLLNSLMMVVGWRWNMADGDMVITSQLVNHERCSRW